jgi:hypothetical protein
LPLPANNSIPVESPLIAGSVLPIQRAEELLGTLPGVISARIVAGATGAVEEIHILTGTDVTPKQTVRNVESALIAHLGMRVSHKKISVAMSDDSHRQYRSNAMSPELSPRTSVSNGNFAKHAFGAPQPSGSAFTSPSAAPQSMPAQSMPMHATPVSHAAQSTEASVPGVLPIVGGPRRRFYFEDVEVRRSRSKGVACRVTLRKGEETFVGEADGLENERLRIELAARATLAAISAAEGERRVLALEGCKGVDAFEREFVFVGVTTQVGRETCLMTGSAEIRESPETASVLAILDATNRWLER